MNAILRVSKYKGIRGETTLTDFAEVNYFVGKNGGGKSSILNAISHLNDRGNARRFFTKDSRVELTIEKRSRRIIWEDKEKNPNYTSHEGDLDGIIIIVPPQEQSEMGGNKVLKHQFRYNNMSKDALAFLKHNSSRFADEAVGSAKNHQR